MYNDTWGWEKWVKGGNRTWKAGSFKEGMVIGNIMYVHYSNYKQWIIHCTAKYIVYELVNFLIFKSHLCDRYLSKAKHPYFSRLTQQRDERNLKNGWTRAAVYPSRYVHELRERGYHRVTYVHSAVFPVSAASILATGPCPGLECFQQLLVRSEALLTFSIPLSHGNMCWSSSGEETVWAAHKSLVLNVTV